MASKTMRIKTPTAMASIMMPWRVVNPDLTLKSVNRKHHENGPNGRLGPSQILECSCGIHCSAETAR
jgi:hypothetical protein